MKKRKIFVPIVAVATAGALASCVGTLASCAKGEQKDPRDKTDDVNINRVEIPVIEIGKKFSIKVFLKDGYTVDGRNTVITVGGNTLSYPDDYIVDEQSANDFIVLIKVNEAKITSTDVTVKVVSKVKSPLPVAISITGPDRIYMNQTIASKYVAKLLPEDAEQEVQWTVTEGNKYLNPSLTKLDEGKIAISDTEEGKYIHPNPYDIKLVARSTVSRSILAEKVIKGYWMPTDIDILGDDVIYSMNGGANYRPYSPTYPELTNIDYDNVKWSIVGEEGKKYATINEQTGQVVLKKDYAGKHTIKIKVESTVAAGISKEKVITIIETPTAMKINKYESKMFIDETQKLTVTMTPTTASADVEWSIPTEYSKYATINANGVVTALEETPNEMTTGIVVKAVSKHNPDVTATANIVISSVFDVQGTTLKGFKQDLTQQIINQKLMGKKVFPIPEGVTDIAENAFASTNPLHVPSYIETLDLTGIKTIGNFAFNGSGFRTIKFGKELTSSLNDSYAFCNMNNLTKIDLSAYESMEVTPFDNNNIFDKKHPINGTIVISSKIFDKSNIDHTAQLFARDDNFLINREFGWGIQDENGNIPTIEIFGTVNPFSIDEANLLEGFSRKFSLISEEEQKQVFAESFTMIIPKNVEEIAGGAFYREGWGSTGDIGTTIIPSFLTRLEFEEGSLCTVIGESAFMESPLREIVIPEPVNRIGDFAFFGSSDLSLIDVSAFHVLPEDWLLDSNHFAFDELNAEGYIKHSFDTDRTGWIELLNSMSATSEIGTHWNFEKVAPDIFAIADGVLYGFSKTQEEINAILSHTDELPMPEGIKAIAANAFDGSDPQIVHIPSNIKTIDWTAANEISEIGANAFNSTPLTSITIPNTVKKIYARAFAGCSKLEKIDLSSWTAADFNECSWEKNAWDKKHALSGTIELNRNDSNVWAPIIHYFGDNDYFAFNYSGANAWTINVDPTSASQLGINSIDDAYVQKRGAIKGFNPCFCVLRSDLQQDLLESTTELVIPSSIGGKEIDEIDKNAFYKNGYGEEGEGCSTIPTWVSKLTIPEGIEAIGEYAFNTAKINSIILPSTLKEIGDYAFANMEYLGSTEGSFIDCSTLAVGVPEDWSFNAFDNSGANSLNACIYIPSLAFEENWDYYFYWASNGCIINGENWQIVEKQ